MTNYPPITIRPLPDEDYPALFRQHVLRSVQAVLVRTQRAAAPGLSEAARTRIFAVLDYALHLSDAWPMVRELLRVLGPQFNLGGYWVQWLPYLEQGISAGENHQDSTTIAALSCDLGLLYQRLGKLDLAETHLTHAFTVAKSIQQPALLGLALQQLAEVERLRRRYTECNALLAEAEALFAPTDPAQAYGLFIRGKAAFDQHDLTTATAAFTEAKSLWQAERNQGRVALCIQNLGRIAAAYGEPLTAIPLYEQAIDLLIAVGDRSNLPVVQVNLGIAYHESQQEEEALALYQEAEANFQTMNDERYLAMVYNNFGVVYTALREWNRAEAYLQRGLALHQQVGDKKAWISTKGNLGILYLEQACYVQAIHTFQEALAELQTTTRDAEYERLWREITNYLTQAEEFSQLP